MVRSEAVKKSGIQAKLLPEPIVAGGPDLIFTVLTFVLILLGSVMLFSAGSDYSMKTYGDSFHYLKEHLGHVALGIFAIIFCVIFLNVKNARLITLGVHGVAIVLLLLVLVIGTTAGGAKRWLNVGPLSVQPSEVAKTTMVMFIALYMDVMKDKYTGVKWKQELLYGFVIPLFGIVAPVCLLVVLEKHVSGTIIIFLLGVVTILIAGVPMKWVGAATGVVAVIGGIIAAFYDKLIKILPSYVQGRLDSWLNRGADTLGSDWQSTQGLYAIGTGGLFGLGIGESRLKYGYVSQPQNDFIFTIVCEELGFFGAAAIMLLFLALFARGMVLAIRCQDKFCGTVIAGLSFKIIIHVLLNIAVVTGVFPNTGISLPFFSSGGSATLIQLADAGIIMAFSKFSKTES